MGETINTRFILVAIIDDQIPAKFLDLSKLKLNVVVCEKRAMIQMTEYLDKKVWRRSATSPTEKATNTDYLANADFISVDIYLNEESTIKPHFLTHAEMESEAENGVSFAVYLKKNAKLNEDSLDTQMHTLYFIRCVSDDPETSHVFND